MKEYDIDIFLVDIELEILHDALTLYRKTVPIKRAFLADEVLDKLYDAIEECGVREG